MDFAKYVRVVIGKAAAARIADGRLVRPRQRQLPGRPVAPLPEGRETLVDFDRTVVAAGERRDAAQLILIPCYSARGLASLASSSRLWRSILLQLKT